MEQTLFKTITAMVAIVPLWFSVNTVAPVSAATNANQDQAKSLLDKLGRIRDKQQVPGFSLLITSAEQLIIHQSHGLADRDKNVPFTNHTMIRVGSITKSFNGLAALRLQAQQKISLEAKLTDYLKSPPLQNPWHKTKPVTLAMLLEHSAGLGDLSAKEFAANKPGISFAQAFAIAPDSRTLRWPPGLHSSYSNTGAGIFAYTLEQHLEQAYESIITQEVFQALGMGSANFSESQAIAAGLATGYDRDGYTEIPYWHQIYRALGGANMQARDMAPVLQMLLKQGQITAKASGQTFLSKQAIKRFETPATTLAARQGMAYGYGLGNYAWISHGVIFHGHGGDADGYLSHYGYSRELDRAYFIVINSFNSSALRSMRSQIERWLVQESGVQLKQQAIKPGKTEDLNQYAGTYSYATSRFTGSEPQLSKKAVSVTVSGNFLTARFNHGRTLKLKSMGNGLFREPDEPIATYAFISFKQGQQQYLQCDEGNFIRMN